MQTEFDRYMSGEKSSDGFKNGTVSIILPVYNAESMIKSMVSYIRDSWKNSWGGLEIIVIDKGSGDRTSEIASNITDLLITVRRGTGEGVCLKKAMEKARGDFRLVIEPRRLSEIDRVPFYLEYLKEGFDLVLGNRFASSKQHGYKGNLPAKVVKRYADDRIAPGIADVRSGFTGYTRRSGKFLYSSSEGRGLESSAEIIGLAKVNKMRVKEVSLVDSDSEPVSETVKLTTAIRLIADSIKIKERLDNEIARSIYV